METEEKDRGTDTSFFEFMEVGGNAVLKLLNVKSPTRYKLKAVVLKEKTLFPDMEGIPLLEGKGERVFFEFQGYPDEMARYNLAAKVALACSQEHYTGKVRMGILYTDKSCKKASLPLNLSSVDGKSWLKGGFHELILGSYTAEQLTAIDPRLVLLAPLTLKKSMSKGDLMSVTQEWAKEVHKIYPKTKIKKAINVLGLFLLHRFHNLSTKEVTRMLNLNLAKTVAGQELIAMGKTEGKTEGKKEGKKEGKIEGEIITLRKLQKQGVIEKEFALERIGTLKKKLKKMTS